jgi:arsenate reductase-like glutaredoxin family protein
MSNPEEMGVIAKSEKLITLYSHPSHHLTTKCLAVAKASKANVEFVDIEKTKLTGTVWKELAEMLGVKVDDIIAKNHPAFLDKYGKDVSLTEESAIKFLQHDSIVLAHPIAVRGEKAIQATNSNDIMKLHKPDSKDAKLP